VKVTQDSEFRPITVVIETRQEAELLHKILGCINDDTEDRIAPTGLFYMLGRQLGDRATIHVEGILKVTDRIEV
jgi:hypothetical protein